MPTRTLAADLLVDLNRRHLVHPVSSFRGHAARGVRLPTSARGATVTESGGRALTDGFAGLWCVNAGYGHDSIVEAAADQMRRLPCATGHVDLGTEAPIRPAAALADRAPGDPNHVYFTPGGLDAVDSTIRCVRHDWHARDRPGRDPFISVASGYHGSSGMGAGLTALPLFQEGFGLPHDGQHEIASHHLYRNPDGADPAAVIAASVAEVRATVREIGEDRVAAFHVEPIQGSGGVLVPPPGWIAALRAVCAEFGILFIADEVITGFGRTGLPFACEDEGIVTDLMTVAKGLTSGYVPMGAVLMSEHVYRTIADFAGAGAVGHGFTYSGHPVSAAVALDVLSLDEGGLPENGRAMGARLRAGLQDLLDHPLVGDVRGRGMLAAVEPVTDTARRTPLPAGMDAATRLFDRAWDEGLIVRAVPQGIPGYAPPLCCTADEIDRIVARTRTVLDLTLMDPEIRAVLN